jgi:hypothetical protein
MAWSLIKHRDNFAFLQIQKSSGVHTAPYVISTGGSFAGRSVKLATHLHLLLRLMREIFFTFYFYIRGVFRRR